MVGADDDEAVRTVAALLEHDRVADGAGDELLGRGEALLAESDVGEGAADAFRSAATYCSVRHIVCRDRGDEPAAERWLHRAREFAELRRTSGTRATVGLSTEASLLHMAGDEAGAADAWRRITDEFGVDEVELQQFGLVEGQLRLSLREDARADEVLSRVLPKAEAAYLVAVVDEDVAERGSRLRQVALACAVARARLDDWDGALRALDAGHGLRLRYRAALRDHPAAAEVSDLERQVAAAQRGARTVGERDDATLLQAQLLERFRKVRPQLAADRLASPSVAQVAALTEPGEAVALIADHAAGTMVAVVLAGDRDRPAYAVLDETVVSEDWLEAFSGTDETSGWVEAIAEPGAHDHVPGLARLLEHADDAVGVELGLVLAERGVRRVTLVLDGWHHLVPWWAVPGLAGVRVAKAASLSEFVRTRTRPSEPGARAVLVAGNPTGDLVITEAVCEKIASDLRQGRVGVTELTGTEATEPAMLAALPHCGVLHFGGHGRSEPAGSWLELAPPATLANGGDPFAAWLEQAVDWREQAGDDEDEVTGRESWADVPGVGRLRDVPTGLPGLVDLRLEHAEGTLGGLYRDGVLVRCAEHWTSGDLLLGAPLDGCRLAILTACESAAGGGRDESGAGLPGALALAGVDTVVGTLWPVDEVFAALWAQDFHSSLATALTSGACTIDVVELVGDVGDALRSLERDQAAARLLALAQRVTDPLARFGMVSRAETLDDRPFADAWHWAAFHVVGRPVIEMQEVSPA